MDLLSSQPRFLSHGLWFYSTFDSFTAFKDSTKNVLHPQMEHAKPKLFVG
jgi:hypothetical protein